MQALGTAGKVVLGVGMAVILWAAFLYAHPAENFVGESSRIVFFHVPTAWISALAFLLAAIHSALYLKTRKIERDDAAASAARLGILFCALATVTGSIFAKVMWNSFWNWDPRETSIVLLLLVYGALFAFVVTSALWLGEAYVAIPPEFPVLVFALGVLMLAGMAVFVIAAVMLARTALQAEVNEVLHAPGAPDEPPARAGE